MTEIMFENFEVPSLFFAIHGVLTLYSVGRTIGIVCDIGDGITCTTPVYEGFMVKNAIMKI